MSRGPRRKICAWQRVQDFRLKRNGKKQRGGPKAAYSPGVQTLPTPPSPCSASTTSMRSPFSRQWIRMRPARAPMVSTTWREMSPNGCKTGSGPTTTLTCRSAIHRARPAGDTRVFAAARGKVTRSCSERRPVVAQRPINVRPQSASAARNHLSLTTDPSAQSSPFLGKPRAPY